MMLKYTIVSAAALALAGSASASTLLWDAGVAHGAAPGTMGLITHFGAGPGGSHTSVLGPPVNIFGGSWTQSGTNPHFRRADKFTVTGPGWIVESITLFSYVTNADVNTNPFGTFNLNVWDAGGPGGNQVGSTSTFNTPVFTNIWRQSAAGFPNNTQRGIFAIELVFDTPLVLLAGDYWWDGQAVGPSATAWMPQITALDGAGNPISPPGESMILSTDGIWAQAFFEDANQNLHSYGLPALIHGSIIPGPGALALLGLAGLVGVRRRRN